MKMKLHGIAISQQLAENVSLVGFLLPVFGTPEMPYWLRKKIFTWASRAISKFLRVINLTLYESFIDPVCGLFSKAFPSFYCP